VPESKPKAANSKPKPSVKSKKDLLKKAQAASEAAANSTVGPVDMKELVEAGDYALTEELFGVEASGSAANPVNREEHEALGKIVGDKLAKQIGSYHFKSMMNELFKATLVDAKADQIKELTSVLNIMYAERQKAEKAKEGGKKKSAKGKKSLARDHSNEADEYDIGLTTTGGGDFTAGFDDGDFM